MNKAEMMSLNRMIVEIKTRVLSIEESLANLYLELNHLNNDMMVFDRYLKELPMEEENEQQGWKM